MIYLTILIILTIIFVSIISVLIIISDDDTNLDAKNAL
jgi:hypothetical protein